MESIHEECFCCELELKGIPFERQVQLPVTCKERTIGVGCRVDVIVASLVLVEIKAVQETSPAHRAQVLTYLKLTSLKVGLLLNFNSRMMKTGIDRLVL